MTQSVKSECQKYFWLENEAKFWRSDITYGVKKDQNVKSLFWQFLTFNIIFDVLIFDVLIKLMIIHTFDVLINFYLCHFQCSDQLKKKLLMFWSFSNFWCSFLLSTKWFLTFWPFPSFHKFLFYFFNKPVKTYFLNDIVNLYDKKDKQLPFQLLLTKCCLVMKKTAKIYVYFIQHYNLIGEKKHFCTFCFCFLWMNGIY
jgi:hypothetical protein